MNALMDRASVWCQCLYLDISFRETALCPDLLLYEPLLHLGEVTVDCGRVDSVEWVNNELLDGMQGLVHEYETLSVGDQVLSDLVIRTREAAIMDLAICVHFDTVG